MMAASFKHHAQTLHIFKLAATWLVLGVILGVILGVCNAIARHQMKHNFGNNR